jgi:glycine amidinotransferase/scyllo-inosamine-4-phosphate amidinotransferase 1
MSTVVDAAASVRSRDPALPTATVHSYDEFTTLREVIVGRASGAQLPMAKDRSMWLNLFPELLTGDLARVAAGAMPQRVVEETEEDLLALVDFLTAVGVTVHRPDDHDHAAEFGAPGWRSDGFSVYCPRDSTLVVGPTLIEAPSPMRARYFETFPLRRLFRGYLRSGAIWIAAPKPQLDDELYPLDESDRPTLGEIEPVFEAANVLRCGADLLYQVSSSGNELGREWLQRTLEALGPYRVHPLRGVYDYTHLDSTISLLRPGLVLLNPERVGHHNMPDLLHGWDVIWCPPMQEAAGEGQHLLSSPWVGMNLLMVSPELAVVDAEQRALIALLERRAITVEPMRLRHARVLGGGFHCVTLDIRRDGVASQEWWKRGPWRGLLNGILCGGCDRCG